MHNKCHQIIQIIYQIITSQQVHQATNHQCNQCMVCHQMDNSCQCLQVVQCLPQVQMVQCHHHMVINQCHYHLMDNICQDNMYQLQQMLLLYLKELAKMRKSYLSMIFIVNVYHHNLKNVNAAVVVVPHFSQVVV